MGVSLKFFFFFRETHSNFFFRETHFHSVTTKTTQAVVTIYFHCIVFLSHLMVIVCVMALTENTVILCYISPYVRVTSPLFSWREKSLLPIVRVQLEPFDPVKTDQLGYQLRSDQIIHSV